MKRFIVFLLCILALSSLVFAIDKPEIQVIERKTDYWTLYWTGLQDYDRLYFYYEGENIDTKKYKSDNEIDLEDIDNLTNGEMYLKWEVFSWDNSQTAESSKIKTFRPIEFYIGNIYGSYLKDEYLITLEMVNRTSLDQKNLDIYINDKLINTEDIDDQWNKIVISYKDYNNNNKINIVIKDKDKYLSSKSLDLENEIKGFSFSHMERKDGFVKVYFHLNAKDTMKVFVDDKELSKDSYDFIWSYLRIYFDINSNDAEHDIYVQIDEKKSKKRYVNVWDYLNPTIKSFLMPKWNRITYENYIIWKNIEWEMEDIKININWKTYNFKKQSYGYWYAKITNKYLGLTDDLIWDKKQEIIDEREKEYEDLQDYLYDFEKNINWEKITFTQKFLYNTGSVNTMQLTVWQKESNTLSFTVLDSRDEQEYIAEWWNISQEIKEKNKLIWTFISTSNLTGTNYDNKEFNLWKIILSEWWKLNYFIDSISFDMSFESEEETKFTPIQYIKLWDITWFVIKEWTKYKLIFENIELNDFDTKTYDIKIKLWDNYEEIKIKIIPMKIDYYIISSLNDDELYSKDLLYENGLYFQNNFLYTPCFDISSDYKNCKELWYKDKSRYNWAIWTTEDSVELKAEEEIIDNNNEAKYILTDKDKLAISIFMSRLDKYIDNKSKWNKKTKELLYKKIYLMIKEYFIKLEDGRKKELIEEIMREILILLKKEI